MPANPRCRLHRIAEIRLREGITLRTMARHLGISQAAYRALEKRDDLTLAEIHAIADGIGVPAGQLLTDFQDDELVLLRGLVIRSLKIANGLLSCLADSKAKKLAESLQGLLLEAMPEASRISSLPAVGRKRTGDEPGRIAENVIHVPRGLQELLEGDYS